MSGSCKMRMKRSNLGGKENKTNRTTVFHVPLTMIVVDVGMGVIKERPRQIESSDGKLNRGLIINNNKENI